MKHLLTLPLAVLLFSGSVSLATPGVLSGADADRLIYALQSVGAPSRAGALDSNLVTTADRIACGPQTQGAYCEVAFDGISRTIEKAQGLTALLAATGASELTVNGRQAFVATDLFCRHYKDSSKPSTCSLTPLIATDP